MYLYSLSWVSALFVPNHRALWHLHGLLWLLDVLFSLRDSLFCPLIALIYLMMKASSPGVYKYRGSPFLVTSIHLR